MNSIDDARGWFDHPLIRSSAPLPQRFWGPERLNPHAWAQFSSRLQTGAEVECLLRALGAARTVLDVGGGTGLLTRHIARNGVSCTVVEPHPTEFSIDAAIRHRVTVIEGSAEALPVQSHAFEAVLATWVLQYTGDPFAAIGELARVCNEAGDARILIVQAAPLNDFVDLYNCVARALGRATAHHGFLLANAATELERRGWTVSLEHCAVPFGFGDIDPAERTEWLAALVAHMHFSDSEFLVIRDVLLQKMGEMPAIGRGVLRDDGVLLLARRCSGESA